MATFRRFEEIKAWQKARQATVKIYEITNKNPFAKDFGLTNQIRRAAVSVMANIAEGNGRRTNADFASFLVQSHGSAAEVQSHLYVALDLGYLTQQDFQNLYDLLDEISKMTMSLAQHLRSSKG